MPYVGNQPAANFASVTKDTFSGNASTTAFTLSKPATTNGVAVYVENVRQIPTTAYAVSGTTLTFTAAPPSGTNNIYVMHHNTPVSTATHPAAQDLTAVNGTMTGTLSVTGATTVGGTSNLTIADGDLVVGTSGHGISFASTSDATGMQNELFDDYEEGLFQTAITPSTSGSVTLKSAYDDIRYTKIGRLVTINADLRIHSVSSQQGGLYINIPFTSKDDDAHVASHIGTCITHSITKQTSQVGRFIALSGDNLSYIMLQYETDSTRLQPQAENMGLAANDEIVFSLTYTAA